MRIMGEQSFSMLYPLLTMIQIKPFSRLAVLLFFVLAACAQSPESAARKFTENLAKGNLSEAKKYATEPTGQMLDFAGSIGVMPVDTDFTFIFISKSVEGDQASIIYKSSPDGPEETIDLVKIDGAWKVHMQHRK
ncbi:hypothetical protein Paes_0152 [Prosthecochloris aestuarii DSM 271]|uniref:Uncharacterized protein n=3 Tax=Prosthecochloris TaxID=1101 RepID=B4S3B7_PROA2|nr:hypothetical protein Paes_0152 [Prosthecochloris aestuarii DSM 271]